MDIQFLSTISWRTCFFLLDSLGPFVLAPRLIDHRYTGVSLDSFISIPLIYMFILTNILRLNRIGTVNVPLSFKIINLYFLIKSQLCRYCVVGTVLGRRNIKLNMTLYLLSGKSLMFTMGPT